MPARSPSENLFEREVISIREMAERLGLSRGRFYELVEEGFFLPPIFLLANRRPAYAAEMARRNEVAKMVGIGVNGAPRVFYRRREIPATQTSGPRTRSNARPIRREDRLAPIKGAMVSLGLSNVTDEQVAAAIAELFPSGLEGLDEGDVIRAVFRHLRRSGVA